MDDRTHGERLRILLVAAYDADARRGNATTCGRYAAAAEAAGFVVRRVHGEGPSLAATVADAVAAFDPHLVHGHHVLRVGRAIAATGRLFVLSEGGTEAEFVERDPAAAARLRSIADKATTIMFASEAGREEWIARGYVDPSRARVVPRGVVAPPGPPRLRAPNAIGPLRRALGVDDLAFVVLVVSGLRPGKDPVRALDVYRDLRRKRPESACVLIGVPVDPETAAEVRATAATLRRCAVLDPVPFETMGAVYADADVLLNTSRFEGVSNALLEAQAAGLPVVAHAIPANVAATPDVASRFQTNAEAAALLDALAADPRVRARRGAACHAFVRRAWSTEAEAAALLSVYRDATGSAPIP